MQHALRTKVVCMNDTIHFGQGESTVILLNFYGWKRISRARNVYGKNIREPTALLDSTYKEIIVDTN